MNRSIQKWKFLSQLRQSSTCKSFSELKQHKCSAASVVQKHAFSGSIRRPRWFLSLSSAKSCSSL